MAVYDILLHQRAVMEFLIKNNSAENIFNGLHHVHGDFFMGSSRGL
jgi:hypothetical protein